MIQRLCHRCQSVLHLEDEGPLIFCWNCGAAQVTLSEELQEQAETQKREFAEASQPANLSIDENGATTAHPADASVVVWKAAIGISAGVAAVLSAVSIVLPPLALLAWLAPAVVLAIYSARHRQTRITTEVGARIGLICGVLSGFGMALATALELLVLRFGLHRGAEFDASMNAVLAQAKTQATVQSGQAAMDVFRLFSIPEFRAGFFLAGLAAIIAILLVLSTLGGAFAGFVRSRERVR